MAGERLAGFEKMSSMGMHQDTSGVAAACSNNLSRSASLGGRAGERAMTDGEKCLAWPMRCEMKPEAARTAADTAGDFE